MPPEVGKINPRKRPAEEQGGRDQSVPILPGQLFIREQNPLLRCIESSDPCGPAFFYQQCHSCGKLYKKAYFCNCE